MKHHICMVSKYFLKKKPVSAGFQFRLACCSASQSGSSPAPPISTQAFAPSTIERMTQSAPMRVIRTPDQSRRSEKG